MPTEYDSVTNQLNYDPQATSGSHSRLAVVLRLLNQCGRYLQTAKDEKHLLQQVCSDLTRGSLYSVAAIYLVEECTRQIHLQAWNSADPNLTEPPLERWDGPYWVLRTLRPYLTVNLELGGFDSGLADHDKLTPSTVNAFALPIWLGTDLMGVMVLLAPPADSFGPQEEAALHALLTSIAGHILQLRFPAAQSPAEDAPVDVIRLFRVLSETTTEASLLLKRDLIVECNPYALQLFRCQRQDIVGKSIYDFSPATQPGDLSSYTLGEPLIDGEPPQFFSWTHQRSDGTLFEAEVHLSSVGAATGKYWVATLSDESARKAEEVAQALNDLRFQAVLENTSDAIAILQNRLHCFVNPVFVRLMGGGSSEQYLAQPLEAWAPPPVCEQLRYGIHSLLNGSHSGPDRMEIHFTRPDGVDLDLEFLISVYQVRTVAFIIFIVRDIGFQKRAAAELQQRDLELNAAAEILNTAVKETAPEIIMRKTLEQALVLSGQDYGSICLMDPLSHLLIPAVQVNPPPEIEQPLPASIGLCACRPGRDLGLFPEEMSANDVLASCSLYAQTEQSVDFHQSFPLQIGATVTGVMCLFGCQGTPAPTDHSLRVLKQVSGTVALALENARLYQQILERSFQLEERVAERNLQLDKAVDDMAAFAYSISHDFKTPLRGIDGYSHILAENYAAQLDETGQRFLENIRVAAQQLDTLIDKLLMYSQMDRHTILPTQVSPNQIIQLLLMERGAEIERRAMQVEVDLPDIAVWTDYYSLTQAIHSVVDNAFKFTLKKAVPHIEIGGEDRGQRLLIWVRDNGAGFDMRFHERIYEIFQRLHRAEDYPGVGIGLAIAVKCMHKIGGQIHAESRLGVGSTFYLEIPK